MTDLFTPTWQAGQAAMAVADFHDHKVRKPVTIISVNALGILVEGENGQMWFDENGYYHDRMTGKITVKLAAA